MSVERRNLQNPSLIDVLDRILDKGIVVDTWARVSLAGLELMTIEGRVVVTSIQTYLKRGAQLEPMTLVAASPVVRITSPRQQKSEPGHPDDLLVR